MIFIFLFWIGLNIFFEHYKDLEESKWVKFIVWKNVQKAREEIIKSVQAYLTHK